MLLLHQVGNVKIGEVVRYTVTYTPSKDRILPSPEKLFVRIRNTSAIALRAAFVHGPYTLSVSAYPSAFNPNEKFGNPRRYGVPHFEPMLKAGGSWECELVVPDDIRQTAGTGRRRAVGTDDEHDDESARWILEVSSQVIFSTSAAVGYELVVARDRKSLNLSPALPVVGSPSRVALPGRVSDHRQSVGAKDGHHAAQPKGVFSRAVRLTVEDTATLWNTPRLPGWDEAGAERARDEPGTDADTDKPAETMASSGDSETEESVSPTQRKKRRKPKQKRVHLVILTHGLHSNLGADMLFLKESIDAAAKQARVDAAARRAREREAASPGRSPSRAHSGNESAAESGAAHHPAETGGRADKAGTKVRDDEEDHVDEEDDDDHEEVIVRGYSGNATKTEKGIKYLGKRLARYVLSMTFPDQPFLPVGKGAGEGFAEGRKGCRHHNPDHEMRQAHKHSTIQEDMDEARRKRHGRPFRITSISFVGHSLGGLVQAYAVAYVQKHSPQFFDLIKPINFIALATPFLGLSNENPLYVKFALDFGLVGRTGQDLGLTWRAPTLARSGWGALVGNLGDSAHKKVYGETQPESKPLLRILPTGPAHTALKKFRNRTVYSNVVNDGIVPLRTSCLLFLDWQGLGRVDKARREAGLVETMVGFGWAELTGTRMVDRTRRLSQSADSGTATPTARESMRQVPQPAADAMEDDENASLRSLSMTYNDDDASPFDTTADTTADVTADVTANTPPNTGPLSGFFNLFKSSEPAKEPPISQKQQMILRRGQTMSTDQLSVSPRSDSPGRRLAKATAGHESDLDLEAMVAPPKTTFFEAAGDLLNPSMPSMDYLVDPTKRPRAIFHDRVYHPADMPSPPLKKRSSTFRQTLNRTWSGSQQSTKSNTPAPSSPCLTVAHKDSMQSTKECDDAANANPDKQADEVVDGASMRVEEKIARGYHRDLSWRKVLVKLEPDAHNNIIVRRMFVNAFGWPVVKHLVDAHFSDSAEARMPDEEEDGGERALDIGQAPNEHGAETKAATPASNLRAGLDGRGEGESREALDEVRDLPKSQGSDLSPTLQGTPRLTSTDRVDSMTWSDRDWMDSENESDMDVRGEAKSRQQRTKMGVKGNPPSPLSWSWKEKIVGKGFRDQNKSPKRAT
ncbi:hypothetical protein DCS_00503 [Drechmeria coniospora]|uniref:DUF676 domain-containing protein n=1 Tax=Drechmeria coniospora TaxID=98403 RepID=A0A151GQK3_DRECN|nr:hypothetical protein DCS_00503 [Drechmeria coniospora]KYK59373.1 hypothetical protein DCS_00503 [Drechmeria coniospora]